MAIKYKRLVVCCDGTGQSSTTGEKTETKAPTNVWRLKEALLENDHFYDNYDDDYNPIGPGMEIPQKTFYQRGIGTDNHESQSWIGKARDMFAQGVGGGLDQKVKDAYMFLAENYEQRGDDCDEIFLFGFSRGAFTVRALASLICNAGLLKKEGLHNYDTIYKRYQERRDTKAKRDEFRAYMTKHQDDFKLHKGVVIRVMGVWDTVGSLGVPEPLAKGVSRIWDMNESYKYHDTSLPTPLINDNEKWRAVIVAGYQALSLDERRGAFVPTLFRLPLLTDEEKLFNNDTGFFQMWFPGVHTDVGGGYERAYRDLSDISFMWMVNLVGDRLAFRKDLPELLKTTTLSKGSKPPKEGVPWGRSEMHDEFHGMFAVGGPVDRSPGQYYQGEKWDENGREYETREFMHPVVRLRYMDDPSWRPGSLEGFEIKPPKDDGSEFGSMWRWEKMVNGKPIVIHEYGPVYGLEETMLTEHERKFFNISNEVPEEGTMDDQ